MTKNDFLCVDGFGGSFYKDSRNTPGGVGFRKQAALEPEPEWQPAVWGSTLETLAADV